MATLSNGDLITAAALSQIDSTGAFTDSITIGLGTDTDKTITFDIGAGASNPSIKYDQANGYFTFFLGTVSEFRLAQTTATNYIFKLESDGTLTVSGAVNDNTSI